ncbi:MAG: hypothetical protein LC541_00195 [Candidatus Thiodiazotropha sp.]|nr:hypothetical protein [Candidatus Thiodiazotropha sp.]MCM8881744.1 hypothetical protein [Candidatus Thiodiazotropha sp.]MCM8922200.1 hypothetical protein [Candidatus Thiodiazotropha sp.]
MSAYRITEIGFKQPEAIFFCTTVEMASGYDIAEWVYVDDQNADVILVNTDLDSSSKRISVETPTQNNERPILVSCSVSGEKTDPFSYTLEKPITYSMLVTLLQKLELELELSTIEKTPPPLPVPQDLQESHGTGQEAVKFNTEHHSGESFQPETPSEPVIQSEFQKSVDPSNIEDVYIQSALHDAVEEPAGEDTPATYNKTDSIQSDTDPVSDTVSPKATIDQHGSSDKSHEKNIYSDMDRPARRFFEVTRFLGLVRKAALSGRPTEITHYVYPPVRIYPDQKVFAYTSYVGLSPDIFRTLASGFSIRDLVKMGEKEPPDSWNTQPLWLLFFIATLYGSEGRLKEYSSPYDKLCLTSKPDFDIVPNHSDYRTTADFMMANRSSDLKTIADDTGIKIKTVVDFCNACEEIHIIERNPTTHSDTKLSQNQKQGTSVSDISAKTNMGLLKRFKSIFNNTE